MKLCIIVLFSLFTISLAGQKNIETQSLFWGRYSAKLDLKSRWQLGLDIEDRFYSNARQHQFLTRGRGTYDLGNNWTGGIAFTYFIQTLPQDPESGVIINRTELRPQIEFGYLQKLSEKWSLSHRYWNEFRFFENDSNVIEYGNFRFRYQLTASYQLSKKLKILAFNELLMNIGNSITLNVFDHNRLGGGLAYALSPAWNIELTYFNWYQQQPTGFDFFNRHIIRLAITHSLFTN